MQKEDEALKSRLLIQKIGKTGELGAGYKLTIFTEDGQEVDPYSMFGLRNRPRLNQEERFFTNVMDLVVFLIHWYESDAHVAEVMEEIAEEASDYTLDAATYLMQLSPSDRHKLLVDTGMYPEDLPKRNYKDE